MKIQRRNFLKTSVAVTATATLASRSEAATRPASGREYYELRSYRLKSAGTKALLDAYLEKALIPALNQRGSKTVGVFTELDVKREPASATPKADSPVWVLIPYASLDTFVQVNADLNNDPAVLKAGNDYLQTPKANPVYDRIDSWLLLAFKGMPKMEIPAFSKNRTATRVFEMRTYESHSEAKALNKMAMFDEGETQLMRDLGMSPVFFGQALAGKGLPHLTYFTGGSDIATHFANWKKFGPDPRWNKMKVDPKYTDNTSKTGPSTFLAPTPYSQI